MGPDQQLGYKIMELRRRARLSLREAARRSGLSPSHLSLVERGEISPTVSTLRKIADALGVAFLDLFENSGESGSPVIRRGQWRSVYSGASNLTFYLLVDKARKSSLEPMYMILGKGAVSGEEPHSHPGEEFLFVVKGRLEITIEGDRYILKRNDSICFDSYRPHQYRNMANGNTELILVVTPPVF